MSDNLKLLHTFAEETVARNHEGLLRILHEDVVVHEAPSLPYGGDHRGPEAYLALFDRVAEVWEFTDTFTYTYFDAPPDAVILQVEVPAIARVTRKPVYLRLAEIFTMRDGKIADLDVYYWDTAAIAAALDPTV